MFLEFIFSLLQPAPSITTAGVQQLHPIKAQRFQNHFIFIIFQLISFELKAGQMIFSLWYCVAFLTLIS